jgi:6,7-dimethyl-8-ribityllumazine synthase
VKVIRGATDGAGRRIAVVAGRFHELVTSKLVEGALAGLEQHGVRSDDITVIWVPGAFEIPLVAQRVGAGGGYDAVICLGAVIRGETAHFELVANGCAQGIAEATRTTGVPMIFEVLAADDLGLAQARAGGAHGNKGWEAAEAALEMASVVEQIGKEEAG